MTCLRSAWAALAVLAVALGASVAAWPMYQISSCEIGLYTQEIPSAQACSASVWDFFGASLIAVLAVPVVICALPAIFLRPTVGWAATGALMFTTVVGLFAVIGATTPSLLSLLGSFPVTFLAVLLASVHQFVAARARGNLPVSVDAA